MTQVNQSLDLSAGDRSRSALEVVHRWLAEPAAGPWQDRLRELAHAFDAAAAGIAGLTTEALVVLSRIERGPTTSHDVARLLEERTGLLHVTTSVALQMPSGEHWLLAKVGDAGHAGFVIWMEAPSHRAWTQAEGAALALAGQTLSRLAIDDGVATRWHRYQERARRQRRLEDVTHVVRRLAHDFGNVLTGIMGFSELALAQLPANAPSRRYLDEGYRAAQQGVQLIEQLRLFSRRTATASGFASPADVLKKEKAHWEQIWGRSPRIHLELAPELPSVPVDAETLRLLLGQLLENAREAMQREGVVTLQARCRNVTGEDCLDLYGRLTPGQCVEIVVADTGRGLSDEAQRSLFAVPFFSTKPRHRGLGLATVYGLIHAHGGGLGIDSAPERGTAVHLFLPTTGVLPDPACQESPARPALPAMFQGQKVLVVDDDSSILHFVRTTLEQGGFRVQATTSPVEALAAFKAADSDPFHLVLSDVAMPALTGAELAQELSAHDADVNVIFMSGQPAPVREFELLEKPFKAERLLGAVRAALDKGPLRTAAGAQRNAAVLPAS